MQGTYRIIQGDMVAESKNIITNAGKTSILEAVAGRDSGFATSILVGIGETPAQATDKTLEFAVGGGDITTSIVDPINQKIYFKASLPAVDGYKIYELGCFATQYSSLQNTFGSGNITMLNFNEVDWMEVSGEYELSGEHSRVGTTSVQYVGFSEVEGQVDTFQDLSYLPSNTTFELAYYSEGLTGLNLKFKNDDSNYFEATGWSTSDGYNISKVLKSTFVPVGTPDWSRISQLNVSASGTSATLALDSIRYTVPAPSESTDSNLVSRTVLGSPVAKLPGVSMDIEYVLELNI